MIEEFIHERIKRSIIHALIPESYFNVALQITGYKVLSHTYLCCNHITTFDCIL